MKQNKHTGKAVHGWLDWRDLFEEVISGDISFKGPDPTLIAILSPADQVWPNDRKERQVDVFFAQIAQAGLKKSEPPTTPMASFPLKRTMLFGIGVDAKEALAIVAARDPAEDADLLKELLAKVGRGEARMRLCAGSANAASTTHSLRSVRMHSYPTEMPSIPSAWDARGVGTTWEMENGNMSLQQDLAPPARSQWQMALDVPEAIMWMPRFRGMKFEMSSQGVGTHLLSAMYIPEVMRENGILNSETVFIFSQAESSALAAARVDGEAEIIVFEVAANEEADWQFVDDAEAFEYDASRCKKLFHRAIAGATPLAAHVVLRWRSSHRSSASVSEEYMTATEFSDPPRPTSLLRTRPTALDQQPVGSRWQIEATANAEDSTIDLNYEFDHSTAKPVEPSLQEVLAIFARSNSRHQGAVPHTESWSGGVKLLPELFRCLGTRKPPGVDRAVLHVAFVRVRLEQ
jgi:hypothetical protein